MKKYLLTIFGDFGKPEKHTEIAITLTPIVDSSNYKFHYGGEFIIIHFESELFINEIYEFMEICSEGLYNSFILNEYDEKVLIFMPEESKNHLLNLESDGTFNGKEMVIIHNNNNNNNEDYFYEEDNYELTSTIMEELKRQLKPPTLDQLLDKISENGYEVLSKFEKGLLEKYSKN
jgi:hypothetical protein